MGQKGGGEEVSEAGRRRKGGKKGKREGGEGERGAEVEEKRR